MKSQGQITGVVIQPHTVTVKGSVGAHRADPRLRTTRSVAVLALVLGSLGAATAVSLSHDNAGHAGAKHPAGTVRLAHTGNTKELAGLSRPWMY